MNIETLRQKLKEHARDEAAYDALNELFTDLHNSHQMREKALHHSANLAWKIINASPDSIFLMDTDSKTLAVNDAGVASVNQPRRLLHGRKPSDYMPPDDAVTREEIITRVLTSDHTIRAISWHDGICFDESFFPVTDPDDEPTGVAIIGRDISERVQAEERLRQNEALLRSFIQQSNDGIFLLESDGSVIEWNPAMELITGVDSHAALHQLCWDVWGSILDVNQTNEERLQHLQLCLLETLHHGHRCSSEGDRDSSIGVMTIQWQDGTLREIMMDVFPIPVGDRWMAGGIVRDVTTQLMLEREIQARERHYRLIVETARDVIFQTNLNSQWIFLNAAWQRLTGSPVEDSLGKTLFDFIVADDREACRQEFDDLISGKTSQCTRELRIQLDDGTTRDIELFASALENDSGQIIGTTGVLRDITEHKYAIQVSEAHTRLQIAYEQERELHDLKRRMMERIEHEFRTPLSIIMTKNHILEQYANRLEDHQRAKNHQHILHAAEGLRDMIEEIAFVVRGEGQMAGYLPESVDLEHHARNIIDRTVNRFSYDHHVTLNAIGDLRHIQVNPELIQHILTPLLTNALKFSPDGSDVEVTLQAEGNTLVIQVRDEGIGILPEDAPQIFDAFYRGQNFDERPGLGIGLTKVKDVIEANDGRVFFEANDPANLSSGTTFTVTLPGQTAEP